MICIPVVGEIWEWDPVLYELLYNTYWQELYSASGGAGMGVFVHACVHACVKDREREPLSLKGQLLGSTHLQLSALPGPGP